MAGGGGEVGIGGGDGRGDAGASHVAVDTVRGRGRYGLTGRGRAVSWSSGTPDSTAGRGGRWQRPLGLVGRGRGQFDTGAGSSVHGRLILAGRKAMMRAGGAFGGVGRGAGGAGGGGGRGAGCLGGGRVADKDDMHANTGVHAAACENTGVHAAACDATVDDDAEVYADTVDTDVNAAADQAATD